MSRSYVRLVSFLAIAVVTSSSVMHNLASVVGSASSSGSIRDEDLPYRDFHVPHDRLGEECAYYFDGDDDGCLDFKTNATEGTADDGDAPNEQRFRSSWSYVASLSLLWLLCFARFELDQLALLACVAFAITGRSSDGIDACVPISFAVVGLLYFLITRMRSKNGYYFDDGVDDGVYYDDETAVSFSLVLGRFTWVVSGSRNH